MFVIANKRAAGVSGQALVLPVPDRPKKQRVSKRELPVGMVLASSASA